MSQQKDNGRKKRKTSILETQIFSIMQKSMKAALDAALDDIFGEWK